MASKKEPYETMSMTVGGWPVSGKRKLRKLVAQGWEVVSDGSGGMSGVHTVTLRRPNPKYKG